MRQIPHDPEAEASVLGAMMLSPASAERVAGTLVASDFHSPANGAIFDAVVRLWSRGGQIDAVTVWNQLQSDGTDSLVENPGAILGMIADCPSSAAVGHYARIVMDKASRRRIISETRELSELAYNESVPVEEILEDAQTVFGGIGSGVLDKEPDDISVEEFLARPRNEISPWVIHGLIRRRHKVCVVGFEGSGKSWLARFVAICAAYGVQPFRHERITPVRTLVADFENPEDALYDSFAAIMRKVTTFRPDAQDAVNRLWWKPQGINLRNRGDLAAFENVIRKRRPDLVCLGPLYAAYENSAKDFGWETAAREVQVALKKLMVRYDFALLIEDHAPQADNQGKRQIRPYGSSFWRRWPDIGIGMEPVGERDDLFKLARWRGDRVPTDWPKYLERGSAIGSSWPFVGRWED